MKPTPSSLPDPAPLLAFGAHPDDIEFGCGAVIARETQGGRAAHFVICSKGEAGTRGTPVVRTREYGYFDNIVWSQFDLSNAQRDKSAGFAESQVGKPYALADDIAIGVALITREHTPRWLERRLASDGEWQCASLGDASLRHAGVHVFNDDRPMGSVFPGSFWHFFRDAGWLPKRILFSRKV